MRFVTFLSKVPRIAKNNFWHSDRFIISHDFLDRTTEYNVPKMFFLQYGLDLSPLPIMQLLNYPSQKFMGQELCFHISD
jgi:hypothetical protein